VPFFPYRPRAPQPHLLDLMGQAVRSQAHVVVEAGTGSGKTACALAAALEGATASDARVLYLTRTNSQQSHVMAEFRRVREAAGLPLVGVALQGRRKLCLRWEEEPALAEADAEEFARMCRDRRRAAELTVLGPEAAKPGEEPPPPGLPGCPYFETALRRGTLDLEAWAADAAPTAEQMRAAGAAAGVCPDHIARSLLGHADLVVASYPYLLHPGLRSGLARWMGCNIADWVVVVDEAHNLPEAARELWSRGLRAESLERAMGEAEALGDPEAHGIRASQLLRAARRSVLEVVEAFLVEDDGPLPDGEFEARLLSQLHCASPRLDQAVRAFQVQGDIVRTRRRAEGKAPRSWLGAAADFLAAWRTADEEGWARLVEAEPARISLALVDAAKAARPLLEARASMHLSATLEPLAAYRDEVGLPPNTPLRRFPSFVGPEQRLALYASDVTTQHDALLARPDLVARLAEHVRDLLALRRQALVCFPSHDLLDRTLPLLPRDIGVERPGMGQPELMALVEAFRARAVPALAGVMGGRLTEGLDFPAEQLELVVVVGLPYARPSFRLRALVEHFEAAHGRGWEAAVEAPALRRVGQAAGRLLRGPGDRGVVVVLDHRAPRLRAYLPDLRPSEEPAGDAARFWAVAPPPQPVVS